MTHSDMLSQLCLEVVLFYFENNPFVQELLHWTSKSDRAIVGHSRAKQSKQAT